MDTTGAVQTPERVWLTFRLAGPGRRAAAWVIDGVARALILLVIGLVALAMATTFPFVRGLGVGALLLTVFFLEWGYGVLFEWWFSGRTPGKMAVGIRVVRGDGAAARLPDYVLRNLMRAADFLPAFFVVGLVTMWIDPRFRRLGDLVAGTVVVVEDRERMLGRVIVSPPVTDQERADMPARVLLSMEELRVVEQFLRRRAGMSPARGEELASLYGPALARRLGWSAPTWTRTLVLAYARATGRDR